MRTGIYIVRSLNGSFLFFELPIDKIGKIKYNAKNLFNK